MSFLKFRLNLVFTLWLIIFVLIVLGIIPRQVALYATGLLVIYILWAPLEESTLFFVRSIPLFIALPLTQTFDNFNMWRLLSLAIFAKWLYLGGFKDLLKLKISFYKHPIESAKAHPIFALLSVILIITALSILAASDTGAAIKRVIYFVNLSLAGMVLHDLIRRKGEEFAQKIIKSVAISVCVVVAVGLIQTALTYFIDIYQFMRFWGEGVQMRQYGQVWSDIAVRLGNTWFAYYGEQLSLRVFSLFPDSHSFPVYVLLGIPALFALAIDNLLPNASSFKKIFRTRTRLFIVWVALALLTTILSGTRGVWAAWVGVIVLAIALIFWLAKHNVSPERKNIFKYISLHLITFIMLFAIAWPIFISPQFLLSKGDLGLLRNRVKSIIDFGETSNAERIRIWKASLESIKQKPILGVGVGNFPVVLEKDVFLARAGATAHNLYLHIAAEIGILGFLLSLWFLWLLFKKSYENFITAKNGQLQIYFAAMLLYLPWVLAYLMTDAVLFDERAFLTFSIVCSIILGSRLAVSQPN